MGFSASVKSAFVNWRDFSSRATRPEYWYFALFVVLCDLPFKILEGVGGDFFRAGSSPVWHLFGFLNIATSLILVVPHTAVGVRRLHDTEHSGWVLAILLVLGLAAFVMLKVVVAIGALTMVVAVLADIVILVWLCTRGTDGPNRFGPPRHAITPSVLPE